MAPTNTQKHMTDTQLNAEQEAFLAFMDASKKSLDATNQISEVFQKYMDATKKTTEAYAEYVRLQAVETSAYSDYVEASKFSNIQSDNANKLHNEWVKIRGY